MRIYLKGYYGYKNFGDELLLFGVIEEIFSRYKVEELIIEVGNTDRIQERQKKNQNFLNDFYSTRGVLIHREKIKYFCPEEYFYKQHQIFQKLPKKWNMYLNIILGNHPFKDSFKIFGGGEVIDESRVFPHNGWNILLLYMKTILKGNFALWWGLGSQKKLLTKRLTNILVKKAKYLLLREEHSLHICQYILWKMSKKLEQYHDFSFNIIEYWQSKKKNTIKDTILINLSPSLDLKKRNSIKWEVKGDNIIYFPCDLNFDTKTIKEHGINGEKKDIFIWTNYTLNEIFETLSQCKQGIGSRLHFLYCLQKIWKNITPISSNSKITYNL